MAVGRLTGVAVRRSRWAISNVLDEIAETMLRGWEEEKRVGPDYWRRGPWEDGVSLAVHRDAEAYQDWEEENTDPEATWQSCQGSGMGRPKKRSVQ